MIYAAWQSSVIAVVVVEYAPAFAAAAARIGQGIFR